MVLLRILRALGQTARDLSGRERQLLGTFLLLLFVGAAWGIGSLLRATTTVIPAAGGTLVEGMVGQPRFVLPILAATNDVDADLSRLLYNGLLTVDERGELVGDLAETIEPSEDGKQYTVRLRAGVVWHDGAPFTTDDVLLTFSLIRDPAAKSPLATAFQGVTVKKADDRTIHFLLEEPYAPFPSALTVGILPAHLWGEIPPQGLALSERALRPIGTGPFQFKKLRRMELSGEVREYRLARNSRYHRGAPLLDGITVKFFATADDLLRALRRGDVQSAGPLSPASVPELARSRALTIRRLRLPQYFAVFFNQAKSAPVSDPAVRRALSAATDRPRLIAEALHGEGVAVETPFPAGIFGHAPDVATTPLDVERAKQNLEEAGWKDLDGDGTREKDGTPLAFTLVTSDWLEYVATANLLVEQWRQIGVAVSVQSAASGTLQADILRPRDYEALLYGEVLGSDPDPYPFWHSTQTRDPGLNLALFKDRDADRLLEEARKTTDREARRAAYRKFQERLIEEVPAIFLYSPTLAYALPAKLAGTFLESASLPADRFAAVQTWHLKTRRVRK